MVSEEKNFLEKRLGAKEKLIKGKCASERERFTLAISCRCAKERASPRNLRSVAEPPTLATSMTASQSQRRSRTRPALVQKEALIDHDQHLVAPTSRIKNGTFSLGVAAKWKVEAQWDV